MTTENRADSIQKQRWVHDTAKAAIEVADDEYQALTLLASVMAAVIRKVVPPDKREQAIEYLMNGVRDPMAVPPEPPLEEPS